MSGTRLRASRERPAATTLTTSLARRPDLLIVTGDLSEVGLWSEYEQATSLLGRLAHEAGLPRRHVAIIPGRGDVNRLACEAHFKAQEADRQPPIPPYFPKWRAFAAAFEEFYREVPGVTFTPDEPWTLFEMPDISVVVAGLNSTMGMSHRDEDDHGLITIPQLNWFATRLADYQEAGWTRIAAIHHGDPRDASLFERVLISPGQLDLRITSQSAGGAGMELVTLRRDPAPPQPSRPQASPDVRASRDVLLAGRDIILTTGRENGLDENSADTFLARVAEATRLRFPKSVVTLHARGSARYIRVSDPLQDKGVAEVRPVGIIDGPVTEAAIDQFVADVHRTFASAAPGVRSELVYGGSGASPELVRRARQMGVRLRSFTDYQGLLDLSPVVVQQSQSLASDRLYPASMYVDQRFIIASDLGQAAPEIRAGLIGQATQWLSADAARLVVVLGDFGRGKTSFLKQLTRRLPDELPDVIPVLVVLRSLEKGPTLADLVGQHLVRLGVEDFSQAKLRYMIESGRVALLLDGFDELELRVGYDTAADYLQTLLNSLTGQAKVVLTSRTQHFRSTSQLHSAVLTALGNRVESRTGSRVAVLEDFTSEQILEFLTNLYRGDGALARARLDLIGDIAGLLELTRNPRMLAFVAELTDERLLAVRSEGGELTAGSLYQEIIGYWLKIEARRQSHNRGLAALTADERFEACTNLALRLWSTQQPSISLHDLTTEVVTALTGLSERGFTGDQAAHSIASGSLLIRTEDDAFTFIHQSIMEWLVAAHAARELASAGTASALEAREMSRLMAAFFRDLAGPDAVAKWALDTAGPAASDSARKNAQAVISEAVGQENSPDLSGSTALRQDLSGLDLRTTDLNGRDLRNANLHRCNLRGMRLHDVNLEHADLTEADFTGALLTGGSLRTAWLTGSKWDYAAILGTEGINEATVADSPELARAAIAGRDRPEVVIDEPGEVHCIAFSPDGSFLAFGSGRTLKIAEVATGRVLRVLPDHQDLVSAAAFSSLTDIAVGTSQGIVRLWDAATGAFRCALTADLGVRSYRAHAGEVTDLAFSPNGDFLATTAADTTVRVWDAASGSLRYTVPVDRPVLRVEFSSATMLSLVLSDPATQAEYTITLDLITRAPSLLPADEDEGVRAHRARLTETERTAFSIPGRSITASTRSRDRTLIAVAYDDARVVIRDGDLRVQRASFGDSPPTGKVVFSPGISLMATGAGGHPARVWGPATGSRIGTLDPMPEQGGVLAFSPDSALIATSSDGGDLMITRTANGRRQPLIPPPSEVHLRVQAVAFSFDGNLIAAVHAGSLHAGTMKLRIYQTATGVPLVERSTADTVLDPATDKPRLDEAGQQVIDHATSIPLTDRTGHRDVVSGMAFSPDGTFLATASRDGTVNLWRAPGWQQHGTLSWDTGPATAVAFSPDGAWLAVGYEDGALRMWDMKLIRGSVSSRLLRRSSAPLEAVALRAHQGRVASLAFSSDGSRLVTASSDHTARVWTVFNPTLLHSVDLGSPVYAAEISPDNMAIAAASANGIIQFQELASDVIIARLVLLPTGGFATVFPGSLAYKLNDDPGDRIWWALKLCRFGPGELDPYVPEIRKLADAASIIDRR